MALDERVARERDYFAVRFLYTSGLANTSSVLSLRVYCYGRRRSKWTWGPLERFLAASLFASNYFYALTGQTGEKVLGVTWSLSLEEQFYLLWPCVLLFSRHHISILRKVLVPCIALIWIYRSAGWGLGHFWQQYVLYSFETRVDAILIGALGALSVSEGSKWWRTISNPTCMAVAAIGLVLCPLLGQRLGIQWFFGPGLIAGCLLSGLLVLQSIVLAPAVLTSRPISWGR